ncbi:MAG: MFS transporter [Acidobacteriota bacterium]|nr:MFS transporter [Acidobacteriota bacterium]
MAKALTMPIGKTTRVRSKKLLWLLFASYFTFGLVLNVVGVIIPVLIKQYHLSLFAGGLLAFAFYISFGVCSVPAGLLADRTGPKPVVLSGLFLMGAGCLAMPWAINFPAIALLAFFIGAGVALLQTAGNPLIEKLDRPDNYHRNLTLTIGFCGIGAFTGPLCLYALQSHGEPWQRLYLGFSILCGVLLVLLFLSTFPPEQNQKREKVRLPEIVKLLSHPIAITYTFAIFFYVGAEVGTASWIVKFFEQVHGVNPASTSGTFLSFNLPAISVLTVSLFWGLQGIGRLISGPLITKLGPRSTLRWYSVAALGCLLLATIASKNITAMAFAACGFFTSVLFSLLFSGAIHTFSESQGALSGLLITASIGGAFIPPLVGLTADHFGLRIAMLVPAFCFLYVLAVSLVGKAKYE